VQAIITSYKRMGKAVPRDHVCLRGNNYRGRSLDGRPRYEFPYSLHHCSSFYWLHLLEPLSLPSYTLQDFRADVSWEPADSQPALPLFIRLPIAGPQVIVSQVRFPRTMASLDVVQDPGPAAAVEYAFPLYHVHYRIRQLTP
jgi:hypothetical protein